jgi:predicted DNA-binding helix-hairpin-helix protein
MSVNIEQPSEQSLKLLRPRRLFRLYSAHGQIHRQLQQIRRAKKIGIIRKFVPAGQSRNDYRASQDSDLTILGASQTLYDRFKLKRVYYAAYIPVNDSPNLPALFTAPPLLREHRLYQADWLLRFYHFKADEIVSREVPFLDADFDPKTAWALRNLIFPLEINKASYEQLLRIPGVGVTSAQRIVKQRRLAPVHYDHLGKIGVILKRAKYFITCQGRYYGGIPIEISSVRQALNPAPAKKTSLFQPSLF